MRFFGWKAPQRPSQLADLWVGRPVLNGPNAAFWAHVSRAPATSGPATSSPVGEQLDGDKRALARAVGSGTADSPRCCRMHEKTEGSSMHAMMRVGPSKRAHTITSTVKSGCHYAGVCDGYGTSGKCPNWTKGCRNRFS